MTKLIQNNPAPQFISIGSICSACIDLKVFFTLRSGDVGGGATGYDVIHDECSHGYRTGSYLPGTVPHDPIDICTSCTQYGRNLLVANYSCILDPHTPLVLFEVLLTAAVLCFSGVGVCS